MHLTDLPKRHGVKRPHKVNGKQSSYTADTVKKIGALVEMGVLRKVIAEWTNLTEGQVIGIMTKHNYRYRKIPAMLHVDLTISKELYDKARFKASLAGKPFTLYVRQLIMRDVN